MFYFAQNIKLARSRLMYGQFIIMTHHYKADQTPFDNQSVLGDEL